MNEGMLFDGIHTSARMMKEATGVALMMRPRGEVNAEMWRLQAVNAASSVPANTPAAYPAMIRKSVSPVAFQSSAVPASSARRLRTVKGEGSSSSEPVFSDKMSQSPNQKRATTAAESIFSATVIARERFLAGEYVRRPSPLLTARLCFIVYNTNCHQAACRLRKRDWQRRARRRIRSGSTPYGRRQ